MDKIIIRALLITTALFALACATQTARAQTALEPTQIMIGADGAPDASGHMTVQALLADSQGHPISKATIFFTTQGTFLSDKSDVVLAEAVTNAKGQAVGHFADDFSGSIPLSAEFRGDSQYAASNATAQVGGAAGGQAYEDHIGVDLPGFNVPPVAAPKASVQGPQGGLDGFIQSLWPAMNGWPVAAVLLLVWSMYFFAVTFVFRVAVSGNEPGETSDFDARRSS